MAKLYELAKAYNVIEQLIEEGNENDWTQALTSLEGSIQVKSENIARMVRSLEGEAEMCAAEYTRLKARADAGTNAARRLKDYLKSNMEAMGLDKVKGELFTVTLQSNPPACNIVDEEAIPTTYKTLIPAQYITDKRRVIEAWKAGVQVAGVDIVQARHLRIR